MALLVVQNQNNGLTAWSSFSKRHRFILSFTFQGHNDDLNSKSLAGSFEADAVDPTSLTKSAFHVFTPSGGGWPGVDTFIWCSRREEGCVFTCMLFQMFINIVSHSSASCVQHLFEVLKSFAFIQGKACREAVVTAVTCSPTINRSDSICDSGENTIFFRFGFGSRLWIVFCTVMWLFVGRPAARSLRLGGYRFLVNFIWADLNALGWVFGADHCHDFSWPSLFVNHTVQVHDLRSRMDGHDPKRILIGHNGLDQPGLLLARWSDDGCFAASSIE